MKKSITKTIRLEIALHIDQPVCSDLEYSYMDDVPYMRNGEPFAVVDVKEDPEHSRSGVVFILEPAKGAQS